MRSIILMGVLASAALNVNAVEYRDSGSPEILQMHLKGSWEKFCETSENLCDIPAGVYHVSILDRNSNLLSRRMGVRVTDNPGQAEIVGASDGQVSQAESQTLKAEIVQYHNVDTWEMVCETLDVNALGDCVLPAGTYQVSTFNQYWSIIDKRIRIVKSSESDIAPPPSTGETFEVFLPPEQRLASAGNTLLSSSKESPSQFDASGDVNGNLILDIFESMYDDADGDLIADQFDIDSVPGNDANNNGVNDRFEGILNPGADANNDGLVDIYSQGVLQDDFPGNTVTTAVVDDVIFVADYESAEIDSSVDGLQALSPSASDAITLSSEHARSGRYSINHRIRKNDDYISAGAWRAESNSIGVRKSRYDQADKIRYQFSIYLPATWEIDDKDSIGIIWQWKRFSSRPDMFVLIRGGDIELRALRSSQVTVMKNYRVGEWIDLQFDVVHSARGDGSVKMYYKYANDSDYLLANEYRGATMLAEGPIDSTYLKWGLYKPDFDLSAFPDDERSIFHDDIRVLKLR